MITVYGKHEIEKIKTACRVVAKSLEAARSFIRPGITTMELDAVCEEVIRSEGANPSCKGYHGFPAATCISVNDVVVHGIPSLAVIKEGDIVSVDITAEKGGFFGDACRTFTVGEVSEARKKLVQVTRECFFEAIKYAVPGERLGSLSYAVQSHAESHGFGVVREYTGHGIGRHMHEDPEVRNFGVPRSGALLKTGNCLAVEPMITSGGWRCRLEPDGWTAKTADGSDAAHYENTVLLTPDGCEILTLLAGE